MLTHMKFLRWKTIAVVTVGKSITIWGTIEKITILLSQYWKSKKCSHEVLGDALSAGCIASTAGWMASREAEGSGTPRLEPDSCLHNICREPFNYK